MILIKKIIFSLLLIFVLCISVNCLASENIKLKLNDEFIKMDVAPVLENDRVLIPVRVLFEKLGGEVSWFPDTQRVVINYNEKRIILGIGRKTAFVGGKEQLLDVPAKIIGDRTMIPVRFVSENLGLIVNWEESTKTVIVTSKTANKYELKNVAVTYDEDYIIIIMSGVGGVKAEYLKLTTPNRMIFDFKDCSVSVAQKDIPVTDENLTKVRVGQYNGTTARVVMDVKDFVSYKINYTTENCIIKIRKTVPEKEETVVPDEPDKETDSNEDIIVIDKNYKSKYKLSDESLKENLVILDPGHGGSEVGAVVKYNGKEIYEKDINIKIAKYVNTYLKNSGVNTYMTREGDIAVGLYQRPKVANSKKGYIFLSIHNNAVASGASANGVQVYYSESEPSFKNMKNREWAQVFYDEIASVGLKKAGLIDNNKYVVINQTDMPAAILECAFVTNPGDLEKLMNDEFLKKLAMKIGDATIKVLNMSIQK